MYEDLLLDQVGVNFLGPAPLHLELLHMLTTFHWNALGSTLGWWFCHNNRVSCNEKFWAEQVTVPQPPLGKDKGWGRTGGGGLQRTGWSVCTVVSCCACLEPCGQSNLGGPTCGTHGKGYPAMGYRCVCTTGAVQNKAGVQTKSRRKKLFSDMS